MPGKRTSFFANSFSLLKQTFTEWLDDQAPQLGAALAYYTVFSLAPLVLLLLAIVGFLFRDDPAGTWKRLTEQMSYFLDRSAIEVVRNIAEKTSESNKSSLATVTGWRSPSSVTAVPTAQFFTSAQSLARAGTWCNRCNPGML